MLEDLFTRGDRDPFAAMIKKNLWDHLSLRFSPDLEALFLADYAHRSLSYVRQVTLSGVLAFGLFGLLDVWVYPVGMIRDQLSLLRYGIICPLLLGIFALTYRRASLRWMQLLCSGAIGVAGLGIIGVRMIVPPTPGFDEVHVGLLLVLVYAYTLARLRFVYASAVSWLVVVAYQWMAWQVVGIPSAVWGKSSFFLVVTSLIGMFASYSYEFAVRKDFWQTRQLQAEQDRSEKLLLNILPKPIADQLKQTQGIIADHFVEVTVLFADLVNFTQLAEQLPPVQLVDLLNQIFSQFDRLVEKYDLEKIKTIGDAYMVVAGIPLPRSDHAQAMADFALEMQATLAPFRQTSQMDLSIRIGLHSGPVVAGVIGLKKFIYDLWGDTVNIASRMESQGKPGCIQVSEVTAQRLMTDYQLSPPQTIPIKGKGEMPTYFLLGKLPSLPLRQSHSRYFSEDTPPENRVD
ncbi:MAG: adenylate/guanylate cyclase domain-containing protein [Cyanobacteriota bacterium]|nr:adenylate/guanylate cyclase domain-containing protein [Cyanobacteriota bacterium]